MSNWRRVDELITYHGKGVTPKYVGKSSIVVLNQKCIRNNKIDYSFAQYIDDSKDYNQEKFLRIGDILINSTGQGTAGRVTLVKYIPDNFTVIVDSHILVLRTNNFFESKCLNYSLFSIESTLQKFMDGSTGQGEFDRVRLFNVKVGYSRDVITQQKIASVLSALDDKIDLNNKINAELEQMAKTLYDYWFVQFDFPNEAGKPYKSSGGKMVYNNVLKKEIPEGWETKRLGDVLNTCLGGTPSTKNKKYWNGNIPWLNSGEVSNFPLIETEQRISEEAINNSSTQLLKKGSVLLSITRHLRVNILGIDACINQSIAGLEESENIKKSYIYYAISNDIERLMSLRTGAQQPHINKTIVDDSPFLIPSHLVLSMYYNITEPIIERIINNAKQNQELAKLRDWLLPMLMNGQVKVSDNYNIDSDDTLIAAEPDVCYGGKEHLDIPSNRKSFARQVLAGKVVSVFKDDPNFSNIKFQKIQFLAEHIIEADLNQNYYYQAAGPYDNAFMKSIYGHFKTQKWFDSQNQRFVPLTKEEKIEGYYQGYFATAQERLDRLFNLLYQTTEAEAEIIATIYAVWNNRIIQGTSISDSELIEDFYEWSDRKQQYTTDQILVGLKWLRDNNLEPKGFGKLIKKAKGK
ncbi:restriction endonuclease subunit S [Sphingobacterium suaedae]|uniref:Restriction endonuclease subunit S n=1 Tax=Sphingobacterium suaedae TaxID=1686402 RepID=A0ABW5KJ56_9SPHI